MTIFVSWQLRVTLDSIRNSCNVFSWFNAVSLIFKYLKVSLKWMSSVLGYLGFESLLQSWVISYVLAIRAMFRIEAWNLHWESFLGIDEKHLLMWCDIYGHRQSFTLGCTLCKLCKLCIGDFEQQWSATFYPQASLGLKLLLLLNTSFTIPEDEKFLTQPLCLIWLIN